jgi:hypothetical protein
MWGGARLPWKTLEGAAEYILRPERAPPPGNIREFLPHIGAHRLRQVSLSLADPSNILTVLHSTQEAKCTDPRDRLYAILGVVHDNRDIKVDYAKTVQEVYRQWATRRIERTCSLDILGACADSGRGDDLPSWVPDLRRLWGQDKQLWAQSLPKDDLPWGLILRKMHFMNTSPRVIGVSSLHVFGVQLGRITHLSAIADVVYNLLNTDDVERRLFDIISGWRQWLSLTTRHQDFHETQHQFVNVILRSVHDLKLHNYYSREMERFLSNTPPALEKVENTDPEDLTGHQKFERLMFPRIHGCQIFVMSEIAELGIVAGNCRTRVDDEVWILNGMGNPVILRPKDECFQVITPCFLSTDWDRWTRENSKPEVQKIALV